MKKLHIVAIAAAIAIVCGIFGVQYYNKYKLKANIEPYVKSVTIRLDRQLVAMLDKSSKITFQEHFGSLEEDIKESDKSSLSIRSLGTETDTATTNNAITYINACQNLTRCLLSMGRSRFKTMVALDHTKRLVNDYENTSSYGLQFAKRALDQSKMDFEKAFAEYKTSIVDVQNAAVHLKDSRQSASVVFKSEYLINPQSLDEFIKFSNSTSGN